MRTERQARPEVAAVACFVLLALILAAWGVCANGQTRPRPRACPSSLAPVAEGCQAPGARATYHISTAGNAILQDPEVTPGVVRTSDAKELCAESFTTKPFRKTTQKMKDDVYAAYGVKRGEGYCAGKGSGHGCEVDHLISLELGGLDDEKDLWPQSYDLKPGAHEKDRLENWLHEQACANPPGISFSEAQKEISTDWYASFKRHGLDKNTKLGVYNPKR